MLLFISFITILAIYSVSRIYAGDDNRLPPASTPKGKQARIVLGGLSIVAVGLLILNFVGQDLSGNQLVVWIVVILIAAGLPVLRYIQHKNKK